MGYYSEEMDVSTQKTNTEIQQKSTPENKDKFYNRNPIIIAENTGAAPKNESLLAADLHIPNKLQISLRKQSITDQELCLHPKKSLSFDSKTVNNSASVSQFKVNKRKRFRRSKIQEKKRLRLKKNNGDEIQILGTTNSRCSVPKQSHLFNWLQKNVNLDGSLKTFRQQHVLGKQRPQKRNAQIESNGTETANKRHLSHSEKDDWNPEVCLDGNEIQVIAEYNNKNLYRSMPKKNILNWLQKNINLYGSWETFRQQLVLSKKKEKLKKLKSRFKTHSFFDEESTDSERNFPNEAFVSNEGCQGKLLSGCNNDDVTVQVIDLEEDEVGRSRENRQPHEFEIHHHTSSCNKSCNSVFNSTERTLTITSIFKKDIVPHRPVQPCSRLKILADKGSGSCIYNTHSDSGLHSSVSHGSDMLLRATKSHGMEQVKPKSDMPMKNPSYISKNKLNKLNSEHNEIKKRKFGKMASIINEKLKNNNKQKEFVLAPGGAIVQIEEKDRDEMEVIKQSIGRTEEIEKVKYIENKNSDVPKKSGSCIYNTHSDSGLHSSASHGSGMLLRATKSHDMEQVKPKSDMPMKNPSSISKNKLNKLNSEHNKIEKRKFGKMASIINEKLKNNNKHKVFVLAPDGAIVQIEEKGREIAVLKATDEMEVIKQSIGRTEEIEKVKCIENKNSDVPKEFGVTNPCSYLKFEAEKKKMPTLENCIVGKLDKMAKLFPNSIQLVESKLPLKEADNYQELHGIYLFSQIFKSYKSSVQCLLCENERIVLPPQILSRHYRLFHRMSVKVTKAVSNEKNVFVCGTPNLNEVMNCKCAYCNTNLNTLTAVCVHFRDVHKKTMKIISEEVSTDIEKFLYCSICDHASVDFVSHRCHMAVEHKMHTHHRCDYCAFITNSPDSLSTHIKAIHHMSHQQYELQVECCVCSVVVIGKARLKIHVIKTHAVQTGPVTWSCTKCLFPFNDLDLWTSHVPRCSKLKRISVSISEAKPNSIFYNCMDMECPSRFSSVADLKKHMSDTHSQGESSDLKQKIKNRLNLEKRTCHLCSTSFCSSEMCVKHQHHLHMTWVNKESFDYSEEKELKSKQEIHSSTTLPNWKNPNSRLHPPEKFELRIIPCGNGFIFSEEIIKTPDELENRIESDASKEYKQLAGFDISLDDLPDGKELAEIGFPNKVGHFCDICDLLIQSYPLYYLHMLNFHQLMKRFQCVVTGCGNTFSDCSSFQIHALHHNQTDVQLKKSLKTHSIGSHPKFVMPATTPKEYGDGMLMKACPAQPDPIQQNGVIQLEPVEESLDSILPEMIQYACSGCMSIFETKSLFLDHVCTGDITVDSAMNQKAADDKLVLGTNELKQN